MTTRAERAKRSRDAQQNKAWRIHRFQTEMTAILRAVEAAPALQYTRFTAAEYGIPKLRAIKKDVYKRRGLHGEAVYKTRVVGEWEALDIRCTVGE